MTKSQAARALTVRSPREGGQSYKRVGVASPLPRPKAFQHHLPLFHVEEFDLRPDHVGMTGREIEQGDLGAHDCLF